MLRIHETSLELIRELCPVIEVIARKDPDLARQLRRAIASVPLNVAEGSDQRGKRRGQHYAIALGSARESLSCLRVAEAFGIPCLTPEIHARFNQVIGTLHVVVHGR